MANFTININTKVDIPYTKRIISFTKDDCNVLNNTFTIGILENTFTPTINFLLNTYTGIGWRTLKLKNIVYTNTTEFYLEHNSVKIPEAGSTVYDINIASVLANAAIPNFLIKMDNLTLLQNETISFDFAIEDSALNVGTYISSDIILTREICIPITPIKELSTSIIEDSSCRISHRVTVHVPAESSRYVTIIPSDAFGSPTITGLTITTNTVYNLIIDADNSGGTDTYSTILLKVYESSSSTIPLVSYLVERNHNSIIC